MERAKRADFCIGYFNLRGRDLLLESVDALPGDYLDEKLTKAIIFVTARGIATGRFTNISIRPVPK
jgi:hypothetical protein